MKNSHSPSLAKKDTVEMPAEVLQRLLQQQNQSIDDDEIDLAELWHVLIKGKAIILSLAFGLAVLGGIISFVMTPKYEAATTLMPLEASGGGMSSLAAKYGGLASMAGISLPSGGDSISLADQAVAVLQSKQFLAEFIRQHHLKPILFAGSWDDKTQKWKKPSGFVYNTKLWLKSLLGKEDQIPSFAKREHLQPGEPSMLAAVGFFGKLITTSQDKKTGLYTLSLKWKDPEQASQWVNELVAQVDAQLRNQAISEAKATIEYINKKLPNIALEDIRTAALNLVEDNIKKITFASVRKQYVFNVIDPAVVPEQPVSPKKKMIVVVSFVFGLMLGVFIVLIRNWKNNQQNSNESTAD